MNQRNEVSSSHSFFNLSDRKLLLLVSIIVLIFLVDSTVAIVADFISDNIASVEGILFFIGVGVVFSICGYVLLCYIRHLNKHSKIKMLYVNFGHYAVSITHFVLVCIITLLILQIVAISQYNLSFIYAALFISYGLWIVVMALLSRAFLTWYRLSSRNTMVLILALSMIAYTTNGVAGLVNYVLFLELQPQVIESDRIAFFPSFDPNSTQQRVNLVYQISGSVAYVLSWIGTVMLLRPYVQRIGKIKFYAILGTAMVYYLLTYPLFTLGFLTPTGNNDTEIMNNILLTSMAGVLSGIVFAVAFLSISRTLQSASLKKYMVITAYGFLLFYVAGSTVVTQAAYPPFGLASLSFTGLACYLIYNGLYSSATTVSQDMVLRRSIRKSVFEQSKFLDSIGTSQMQREIQGKILTAAKKTSKIIEEETGVESSMTEDDMDDYLRKVIEEIHWKRESSTR